jgi:hypothetical protein
VFLNFSLLVIGQLTRRLARRPFSSAAHSPCTEITLYNGSWYFAAKKLIRFHSRTSSYKVLHTANRPERNNRKVAEV